MASCSEQKEGQWPDVMKNAVHQYEDKLLEFAYGELPQHEADAVDAHVRGCARCSQSLAEIRGVRATMAQLPMQAAPDAGLDSLLAYAEQAAKRNAETQVKPSLFRRFLMPLASVMALATVGVVAWRANQEFDTSPAAAAADAKAEEYERGRQQAQAKDSLDSSEGKKAGEAEQGDTYKAIAQAQKKNEAPPTTAVTEKPTEQPQLAAGPQQANDDEAAATGEAPRDPDTNNKLGKLEAAKRDAPQATTRSSVSKTKAAPREPVKDLPQEDWSNAAQRGGLRENWSDGAQGGARKEEKKAIANSPEPEKAEPPKPEPKPQDKAAIFGLGTGSTSAPGGGLAGSGLGDLGTADGKKQRAKVAKEEEAPAPVVAAAPTTPAAVPSSAPAPSPKKAPAKGSLSIGSMGRSSTATPSVDEDTSLEATDSVRVDNDAKFTERRRQAAVTQSLESARVASNQGDRMSEVKLLLEALKNGPTGYQKVETLKRLCDAFEALGEYDRADPYCDQLLSEFPGTAAAQAITQRRNATQRMPARPAPAAERSKKELDSQKAEPAEQNQSVPTQAY